MNTRAMVAAGALLAIWLPAQQALDPREVHFVSGIYTPPGMYAVKSETRLVEIAAVVRDRDGKPVTGLAQSEFQIFDQGKPRQIAVFSAVADTSSAPAGTAAAKVTASEIRAERRESRTVAFFFDDVNSSVPDFGQAKLAAARYLKQGMPQGPATIFTSSGYQVIPFTNDAAELSSAMEKLNARSRPAASATCPSLTPYVAYRIANNQDNAALTSKVVELRQCDPKLISANAGPVVRGQTKPPPVPNVVTADDPDGLRVIAIARRVWQEQQEISKATLDAVKAAIATLKGQPGPRVLVLASSGFLTGTMLHADEEAAISLALQAGVTIHALDIKGMYTTDASDTAPNLLGRAANYSVSQGDLPAEAGNDVLASLSAGTGGRFLHNTNDLGGSFRDLATAPLVSYTLAFTPAGAPDGKFHNLKITLPGHAGYTVEARPKYFSEPEKPAAPRQERRIDREVFSDTAMHDSTIGVDVKASPGLAGKTKLEAVFTVDVGVLPLAARGNGRGDTVLVLLALLDQQNRFVAGREGTMEFTLTPASFAALAGRPLHASLELDAPPGKYRLRVLAEEQNLGHLTAAAQIVNLKN